MNRLRTSRTRLAPVLVTSLALWAVSCRAADERESTAEAARGPDSVAALEPRPAQLANVRFETVRVRLAAEGDQLHVATRLELVATEALDAVPLALADGMRVEAVRDERGELGWSRATGEDLVWVELRAPHSAGESIAFELVASGRPAAGVWGAFGDAPGGLVVDGASGAAAAFHPRSLDPSERAWLDLELELPEGWRARVGSSVRLGRREVAARPTAAELEQIGILDGPSEPPPRRLVSLEHWRSLRPLAPRDWRLVAAPLETRDASAFGGRASEVGREVLVMSAAGNPAVASPANAPSPSSVFERVVKATPMVRLWAAFPHGARLESLAHRLPGRLLELDRRLGATPIEPMLAFLDGWLDGPLAEGPNDIVLLSSAPLVEADDDELLRYSVEELVRARLASRAASNEREASPNADAPRAWREGLVRFLAIDLCHPDPADLARARAFAAERARFLAGDAFGPLLAVPASSDAPRDWFAAGGACLLESIAIEVGREPFDRALTRALREGAPLLDALARDTGLDLEAWTAAWRVGSGAPRVHLRWSDDPARERVLLHCAQKHAVEDGAPSAFSLPIAVRLASLDREWAARARTTQRREILELPREAQPQVLRVDEAVPLPLFVELEQPSGAEVALLRFGAPGSEVARAAALRSLARVALGEEAWAEVEEERAKKGGGADEFEGDAEPLRRTSLIAVVDELVHDPAQDEAARAALTEALGGVPGAEARGLALRVAGRDSSPRVRVAALFALQSHARLVGELPEDERDDVLARLEARARRSFDEGQASDERAAAAALFVALRPDEAFEFLRQGLNVESPGSGLRARLVRLIGRLKEARARQALVTIAEREDAAHAVRAAALRALRPAVASEAAVLEAARTSRVPVLRAAAIDALAAQAPAGQRERSLARAFARD